MAIPFFLAQLFFVATGEMFSLSFASLLLAIAISLSGNGILCIDLMGFKKKVLRTWTKVFHVHPYVDLYVRVCVPDSVAILQAHKL